MRGSSLPMVDMSLRLERLYRDGEIIVTNGIYLEANRFLKGSSIRELIYDPKEWNIYAFNTLTDGLDVEFIPEVDLSHRRRV